MSRTLLIPGWGAGAGGAKLGTVGSPSDTRLAPSALTCQTMRPLGSSDATTYPTLEASAVFAGTGVNASLPFAVWRCDPELPNFVELTIARTDPGVRGDTAQGGNKPATLETGVVVQVPLFLNEGDVVKVDTRTGEYLGRVAVAG